MSTYRKRTGYRTPTAPSRAVYFRTCQFCGSLYTARSERRAPTCNEVECRRALKRKQMREFNRNHLATTGESYKTTRRKAGLLADRFGLTRSERLAIFERDGWMCQLCYKPVDPDLDPNDNYAPSLDHIVCRSWTAEPDHSPSNLRLAHRRCNSIRNNRPEPHGTEAAIPHGR